MAPLPRSIEPPRLAGRYRHGRELSIGAEQGLEHGRLLGRDLSCPRAADRPAPRRSGAGRTLRYRQPELQIDLVPHAHDQPRRAAQSGRDEVVEGARWRIERGHGRLACRWRWRAAQREEAPRSEAPPRDCHHLGRSSLPSCTVLRELDSDSAAIKIATRVHVQNIACHHLGFVSSGVRGQTAPARASARSGDAPIRSANKSASPLRNFAVLRCSVNLCRNAGSSLMIFRSQPPAHIFRRVSRRRCSPF